MDMEERHTENGVLRRNALKLLISALPAASLAAAPAARALATTEEGLLQQQALGDTALVRIVNPLNPPVNPHVNSYLLVRGGDAALIDTGLPGSIDRVADALKKANVGWDALRHIVLTHYHGDHMGSAPDVLAKAPHANLWVGAADVRLANFAAVQPAHEDDEILGLKVVSMPGHTPGHISLLDPSTRALFVGDSIFNLPAGMSVSLPQFTWNQPLMLASVRRVQDLGVDRAYFGHGEPIEGNAAAVLAKVSTDPSAGY